MKQTIIKINERNWEHLNEIEAGTMDKKLNVLMDIVEPLMPMEKYSTNYKSVKVYKDTVERLESFHLTETEARDNILTRMFLCLDEINNTNNVTEEWISFKLTNPYNNLLIISGQLEYNSKQISFNYRGNVYLGKLPPNYIVNGKDLTKELHLWYDNLDWNEIINHLLINVDTQTIIDKKDYSLEINDVFSSY